MKNTILMSFLGALLTANAEQMRDAATHEQLLPLYRKAMEEDPMHKMLPAKGPDPSTAPRADLVSDSDVICYNGSVTLVPKRAILQMPKNLADRFKYHLGAKLMSWADFYSVNRGWITTVEVSRIQAEGSIPIAEETQKQMAKSANLIVATYQAGPISVLPLKVPAETTIKTSNP